MSYTHTLTMTLAADVRVATEHRLKSLEADLTKAEQAHIEHTIAARYHKVKLLERQKLLRKTTQVKRQLKGTRKSYPHTNSCSPWLLTSRTQTQREWTHPNIY
ncbi:hypothetical protein BD310DRAFT_940418 [Dichomitus squalens]|uniref:rRNA-processing protein EFG1 n=1 Tax=Dichomitus squalens TaxID=114155 RepID=A0A4Q9PCP0_9APHY|nr:hypothetical protein BD310DRAFT_940418 [Dichomitus squalens]